MKKAELRDDVITNKAYAKLIISDTEALDFIALKVIRQDLPPFLMPIKVFQIDGETELRYEIGNDLRFQYLSSEMKKEEFLYLLKALLVPFKECNDWFLDHHNFYLDKNYITVAKDYMDIRYIYIPSSVYAQTDEEILAFFKEFILNINLSDDKTYVLELFRILSMPGATLGGLIQYMEKEGIEKAAPSIPQQKQAVQQEIQPKPAEVFPKSDQKEVCEQMVAKASTEEKFGVNNIQKGLMNDLFGGSEDEPKEKKKSLKGEKTKKKETAFSEEKKRLFGGIFGNGKNKKESNMEKAEIKLPFPVAKQEKTLEETAYYDNFAANDVFDATCIEGEDRLQSSAGRMVLELIEDGGYQFPKYVELNLEKGYAMVGRYDKSGAAQADYNFAASFSFISRRHFRIEQRNGGYSIMDVGSGNGTFLNGTPLTVNMSYPLQSGDKISISRKQRITYQVC